MGLFSRGSKQQEPTSHSADDAAAAGAAVVGTLGQTHLLHCHVASRPNAVSTICGDRRRTWAQTKERVARLGAALRGLGVGAGDRVGILAMNSDRYTEFLNAVWWIGAVVVPMNIRWSPAENAYSLNDSGASILFVDKPFSAAVPAIQAEAKALSTLVYLDDDAAPDGMLRYEALIDGADPCEDVRVGGETLAGLYYTGGTTGFPKGVMVPQRALWYNNMAIAQLTPVGPDSVYLHAAPMFHMADAAFSGGATLTGATHVYIPAFSPEGAIDAIEAYGVTETVMVPTMLGMMLQSPAFDPDRLKTLRLIGYGGSPMPEGILRGLMEKLPHVEMMQAYGQTELAPLVTALMGRDHVLEGPRSRLLRAAGQPVVGCEIKVVNPEGETLPVGEVGEIAARSPGVMHGYWRKPEQTAAALRDGWVWTGDGGYLDEEGYVFIVDRMKDMIVTGGENVFSAEVESAISKMPGVAQVAVIGIPAEKWGEAVHAIVVPAPGVTLTEQAVMDFVAPLIANYKRPRSVEIRSEPLPMSGAGKILKRDLREPFWEGQERQVS